MSTTRAGERKTLVMVGVIIAGGLVAGLLLGPLRPDDEVARPPVVLTPAPAASPVAPATKPMTIATARPVEPAAPRLDDAELAALGNDSMAGPAASRLAAIDRLAAAPRDQSLPLLERVLLNGEPGVDRPAALLALQRLALAQGDRDGRIRDAVRRVIYHGDDAALAAEAQQTLDRIDDLGAR